MTDNASHLGDELLDRLRAGLLDDAPAQKAQADAHLAQCAHCRARSERWNRVIETLALQTAPSTRERLEVARRSALRAGERNASRSLPRLTAIAAALTLALGLGLFLEFDSRVPATDTGQAVVAAADADLLNELDFYIWLAQEDAAAATDSNET